MIQYLKNDQTLRNDVFKKECDNSEPRHQECRTRYSFHAEFEGCLSVQKGQTVILQRHNNDGWSLGNGLTEC